MVLVIFEWRGIEVMFLCEETNSISSASCAFEMASHLSEAQSLELEMHSADLLKMNSFS